MFSTAVLACLCTAVTVLGQATWDTARYTCNPSTCQRNSETCRCRLVIEHRLTMMIERTSNADGLLVVPNNGKLYHYANSNQEMNQLQNKIITADGEGSRLVIAVNGEFPGPTITAYEGQRMIIEVVNKMHTDSTTVHWHGIHQRGTPWSDGVAFASQCPILPGQSYTYTFTAKPHGTSFYHAHIGDQRTMGLYGSLIIYPDSNKKVSQPQNGNEHLLTIQDWNHNDDAEALYQRMLHGIFDFNLRKQINTTMSVDGANFSRFHFHAGLINGKGRFYKTLTQHNGAPLEIFEVSPNTAYLFRVISASTLYPFRVFVEDHTTLTVVASDGFELDPIQAESFIIHPGERYDFLLNTKASPSKSSYLLIAESLEVGIAVRNEVHIAEAIIWYKNMPFTYVATRPTTSPCSSSFQCVTFNCPFMYYPSSSYRSCLTYNNATSADPDSNVNDVKGNIQELFFNFGFPGNETPGSVNGRQYLSPTVNALTQYNKITTLCGDNCGKDKICECTYSVTLKKNLIYQFVLTNLGAGSGWSHPVHVHGHSFYVLKYGFGRYSQQSAKLLQNNDEVDCNDELLYCNEAKWADSTWIKGNVPGINLKNPAQKDTVIVPTGAYVVIRFKADNPGVWFFHCHIDLHNTNGMGMMLYEEGYENINVPKSVLRCGTYNEAEDSSGNGNGNNGNIPKPTNGNHPNSGNVIEIIVIGSIVGLFYL